MKQLYLLGEAVFCATFKALNSVTQVITHNTLMTEDTAFILPSINEVFLWRIL